ncbi:MAG TPA: hypothetical protein P5191_09305 [Ruminococcus sp.]|nr:hypothetical protein [Ruminococcus sp.]
MDPKTSTKNAIIFCTGLFLSILAQVILYKVEKGDRLVIIFGMTGVGLITIAALVTAVCIGGFLAVFIDTKGKDGKPRKVYKAVIFTLGMIILWLPAVFYFFIMLICAGRGPSDPKKIKSPDGKHFIVRTSDTAEGHSIYCYYVKEHGVVYRPIFEDFERKSDPELQWTDEGVIYEGKLYEY